MLIAFEAFGLLLTYTSIAASLYWLAGGDI